MGYQLHCRGEVVPDCPGCGMRVEPAQHRLHVLVFEVYLFDGKTIGGQRSIPGAIWCEVVGLDWQAFALLEVQPDSDLATAYAQANGVAGIVETRLHDTFRRCRLGDHVVREEHRYRLIDQQVVAGQRGHRTLAVACDRGYRLFHVRTNRGPAVYSASSTHAFAPSLG